MKKNYNRKTDTKSIAQYVYTDIDICIYVYQRKHTHKEKIHTYTKQHLTRGQLIRKMRQHLENIYSKQKNKIGNNRWLGEEEEKKF